MGQERLPAWAQRIRRERERRGWSQADAVAVMLAHGDRQMPSREHVLRRWKSWEAGDHMPSDRYQALIATMFGTVRHAIFPAPATPDRDRELIEATGLDTVGIVTRLRSSDVDETTMEALRITVDRLCTEYSYLPAEQLVTEGREWLGRVVDLRNRRLTLAQHREVLTLAGWLALLVGCVENDSGDTAGAEATRRAALSIGAEAGHGGIQGWAYEMRAWFALTSGDYRGVVEAARVGSEAAGRASVTVQLAAQEAKAWARIGDRRQVELSLERGRRTLESLPYPSNVRNHFEVDPSKFDFYAMDVYRILGEDKLAADLADEVLRVATPERSPMRYAEARATLGTVAARQGELEQAVELGSGLLTGGRLSKPHFLMLAEELAGELQRTYANEPATRGYLDLIHQAAE